MDKYELRPIGMYGYWIWDIKGNIDYSKAFPQKGLKMKLIRMYPSDGKTAPPQTVIDQAQGYVLQVCKGEYCEVRDLRKAKQ